MGDPISAGVVGSAILPEAGVALAAPTITSSLATGLATGGMGGSSLFGFDPTIGGFGQGIMEGIKGANTWMNQNPMTAQIGMQAANKYMEQPQLHYAQPGQISRGQIQPMDYMSLLNPQQSTVIRPQPISLL